jgi:hypothetical protein
MTNEPIGLIILITSWLTINITTFPSRSNEHHYAPTADAGPTLWTTPQAPGQAPANTDGTAAQISAARHIWEEDVQTYRTCTSIQHALKKKIISVFEPMYLYILNDNMVGYANISAIYMLDHLFETYGNITAVDLKINFEHMRRAWDHQQPVESLFKKIQDCANYSEAGGVLIGHPQQINVGYATIFAMGHFMSACRRWNEEHTIEKTWTQFKSHFAAAHHQHKQMQGESAATSGYHSANAAVSHNEDQMAEATIEALSNLATSTAADRGVVAVLTQANSRLAKQLEDNSTELRELKALLKKERSEKRGQRNFNPYPAINVVLMATKLVEITRASLVNSRNPATKRRPLERITREVVRPTGNDVQGRQL